MYIISIIENDIIIKGYGNSGKDLSGEISSPQFDGDGTTGNSLLVTFCGQL